MALDNICNLHLSIYYICETHSACWISLWALSSPSWRSSSPQSRHRWLRDTPRVGLCCHWCLGSSWCIALLSFYSSPLQTMREMWVKSRLCHPCDLCCADFWGKRLLSKDIPEGCHPSRWGAYLWTVKVCCQHNDWVGKDVSGVSAGKEGLPRKLKRRRR